MERNGHFTVQFIFVISDIYLRMDKPCFPPLARKKAWSDELTATLWTPTFAQTNPTLCDYGSWFASLKNGAALVVMRRVPALYPTIHLQFLKYSAYHTGILKKHDMRHVDTWDSLMRQTTVGISGLNFCTQVFLDAASDFTPREQ